MTFPSREIFLLLSVLYAKTASGFSLLPIPIADTQRIPQRFRQLHIPLNHHHEESRRKLFLVVAGSFPCLIYTPQPALAARFSNVKKPFNKNIYDTTIANAKTNATVDLVTNITKPEDLIPEIVLSSERCLLELLPVKNAVFLKLVNFVETINVLRAPTTISQDTWKYTYNTMTNALTYLDNQRRQLEPIFCQDDSTLKQILKAERGELLAEQLREELVALTQYTQSQHMDQVFQHQKKALLVLADIGELLVGTFPYQVPQQGKFANLPRLMGRARVTFTFQRGKELLGNVTIVADGFAAPITAGNFVDLSIRNFYTGLPIKMMRKRLSGGGKTGGFLDSFDFDFDSDDKGTIASVPILGSYREGFFDPLTAKVRKIPLEIVRADKLFGAFKVLTYAKGFSDITTNETTFDLFKTKKPLLSFDVPGLVAMNHPDRIINGGSSEFFSLQRNTLDSDKDLAQLDGQYAPFGYIIDGYDLFQSLKANDVIESTMVEEWGQGNLVKVKGNSFSDVLGGLDDEKAP